MSGGAPPAFDLGAGDHAAPFGAALQRADAQVGPRRLSMTATCPGPGAAAKVISAAISAPSGPGASPQVTRATPASAGASGRSASAASMRARASGGPPAPSSAVGARLGRQADVLADAEGEVERRAIGSPGRTGVSTTGRVKVPV